jgi:hypothetical protein
MLTELGTGVGVGGGGVGLGLGAGEGVGEGAGVVFAPRLPPHPATASANVAAAMMNAADIVLR